LLEDFVNHTPTSRGLGSCPDCTIYTAILPDGKSHHQKNPFQLKKKFGGGDLKKGKGIFLVGRAGRLARRRWG